MRDAEGGGPPTAVERFLMAQVEERDVEIVELQQTVVRLQCQLLHERERQGREDPGAAPLGKPPSSHFSSVTKDTLFDAMRDAEPPTAVEVAQVEERDVEVELKQTVVRLQCQLLHERERQGREDPGARASRQTPVFTFLLRHRCTRQPLEFFPTSFD
ncbi:hypothetical protein DIPPA_14999 [Diplonema papillatum]|nr:hypothetical protein DIPPA_14999 [Diplonema papillatum]